MKKENLLLLIILSLIFLALNSIFAKIALANNYIDAYSFTFYRLIFGAITLMILFYFKNKKFCFNKNKNYLSSFMLFSYALCFSYAYISLDAGFGALVLFTAVQVSMFFIAAFKKEVLSFYKILGMIIALLGLIYLLYPKEEFEVSLVHAFLMIVAGISWAFYSVLGKNSKDSLSSTADNFLKASFFISAFYFIFIENTFISKEGLVLAFISGSFSSAIGYIIWYKVLKEIEITTASIIQLIVPIIAIFLSVIFLDEKASFTLFLSSLIILSGILISFKKRVKKI